jgi:hypothetical protein
MKCSEIIADRVSKARWSWDCVSVVDPRGRRQRMRLFIRQGTAICLFRFGMLAMFGAENTAPQEIVATNVPNATLPPVAQARSLGMLSQVVMQLEHHVQSKDLSAIHNEDVILGAAARELLSQADAIASNQRGDFKSSLTAFCSRVSALHLVADLNQQASSETELGKVLESFADVKAHFSKEIVAQAQVYVESFTCPMHRDVIGKRTDFCPKCGMALDSCPEFYLPTPVSHRPDSKLCRRR